MNIEDHHMYSKIKAILQRWQFAKYFLSKIIFFAVVYWFTFLIDPDSFNFSSGYNVTPFSSFRSNFYSNDETASIASVDTKGVIDSFILLGIKLDEARDAVAEADAEVNRSEAILSEAMDHQSEGRTRNIETYERNEIAPLKRQFENLDKLIDKMPLGSAKIVDLRKKQLKLSEEVLHRHNFLLANSLTFVDEEDATVAEEAFEAVRAARLRRGEARDRESQARSEMAVGYSAARDAVIDQVGFLDFLYFSACVSTTTTFGDITANKPILRVFVAMQILIGIILLAFFLEKMKSRLNLS